MSAHDRGIDQEVTRQGTVLRLEAFPELAPDPAPFPAAKAVIDRVPVPKVRREVAPGRPRAGQIEDGFNEHPIAECRGAASAGFDGGKDGGNLRPGRVSQQQTYSHEVSSRMNGREKT